jgi:hypothetical protein
MLNIKKVRLAKRLCLYRASPILQNILFLQIILYEHPSFLKTYGSRLIVLDTPYFADADSRTERPIQYCRLAQLLRPIPRSKNPVDNDLAFKYVSCHGMQSTNLFIRIVLQDIFFIVHEKLTSIPPGLYVFWEE